MSKIGPKELALRAAREDRRKRPKVRTLAEAEVANFQKAVRQANEKRKAEKMKDQTGDFTLIGKRPSPIDDDGIPSFLRRTETPEQEAERDARHAKKPDDPKLKVTEPYDLSPEAVRVREAIKRDLAGDLKPKTTLLRAVMTGEVSTAEALSRIPPMPKGKRPPKKLTRALEKALAEKEAIEKLAHPAPAKPMESDVRKKQKKSAAKGPAKKQKPAKQNGKTGVNVQDVADMMARKSGASMEELTERFGIDAHPMRSKVFHARHKLGYAVERREGRYYATPPKA